MDYEQQRNHHMLVKFMELHRVKYIENSPVSVYEQAEPVVWKNLMNPVKLNHGVNPRSFCEVNMEGVEDFNFFAEYGRSRPKEEPVVGTKRKSKKVTAYQSHVGACRGRTNSTRRSS